MPSPDPEAEKAKANANLLVQPSKFEALKSFGWIQPYDYCVAGLIACTLITLLFWRIFGSPTALNLIAFVLVDIFLAQLWLISLVFRCSCFVLETRADINLMPESAARIVAGYMNLSGTPNRTRKP